MKLTTSRLALVMLAVVAGWAICNDVRGQSWQPTSTTGANQGEWEQRVLRRPSQPLRWQSAGPAEGASTQYDTAPSHRQSGGEYRMARRNDFDSNMFETGSAPSEPSGSAAPLKPVPESMGGPEVIGPGTPQFQTMQADGEFAGPGGGGCSSCGGTDGQCDMCDGPACGQGCDYGYEVFDGRCRRLFRDLSVFFGADAFRGPLNRRENGSFGFNEGLCLAAPLGDPWGCGYQIGANFVQSNFSGNDSVQVGNYTLHPADRHQYFVTTALFRRPECEGFHSA